MVLSSVIAGASGGALANVALSPLGGGAGLLQSYWYGAGLILGERMMYTFHWEKIKTRLDNNEDFLQVLESEMNPAITAIANYSLQVMQKTGALYMQGGIDFMAKLIENMLKLLAGETIDDVIIGTSPPPTEPAEPPLVQCPAGFRWSISAQQCVPEDIPEPEPIPPDPLIDDSNKAFIPPIVLKSNGDTAPTSSAIALVRQRPDGQYETFVQLTAGNWVNLRPGSVFSNLTFALEWMVKAYPEDKYFINMRVINGQRRIYYFRYA